MSVKDIKESINHHFCLQKTGYLLKLQKIADIINSPDITLSFGSGKKNDKHY